MKDAIKYLVKVGDAVVEQTTNQKKAKAVFRKKRAQHGGKAKFFVIHHLKF